jgi:hypothetical protein
MIISRGRKYIFVHIPKTGGTAMATALEGRAMRDDIMLGDTPKARKRRGRVKDAETRGRLWKHSTLADIDGLLRPEEIAGMFVFTLVRNPWDRMVSYYHWLREQSFDHPSVHLARALDFSSFIRAPAIAQSLRSHPYGDYVTDATGQERAALFIRLEHFDTDAAPLWQHLGFRLDLPMVNRSERTRDYRHYYSDDDSARVAEFCARDIEKFGYRFD